MTPREQVLETLADFARATDARDIATVRGMLHPECKAYGSTGVEAVLRGFRDNLGGVGPTQHLLGNHRVSFLDEHTARVYTYARIMHVGAGPKEGATLELFGEYDDLLVRAHHTGPGELASAAGSSGSGWLIKRRRLEIHHTIGDWDVLRPAD
ncbi:nuclear transport factor 2 family protein [Nocardioides daejeonensis]|uniref:nuclear transport factor 2 family protein n=1 Tax=Nocardioides daejeonensis TaxID=1046556 RepID=UPI000D749419|nr:nuclear transport factor 2 family protein [Nocardioides daejeonensis]